jgi:hypothetical protein
MYRSGNTGVVCAAILADAVFLRCSQNDAARVAPSPNAPARAVPALPPDEPVAPLPPPRVAVDERDALQALERAGFGLGELAAGASGSTTAALNRRPAFKTIFDVLRKDVLATAIADRRAKVTSVDGFRLFDVRWFDSDEMHFELTGVFNRLDRRAFAEGTCGELRFLYRLAYEVQQGGATMASRLPMTVNVVFLVASDGDRDCRASARSWQAPESLSGAALSGWLTSAGPLASSERSRWQLKSVETNQQTVRWQSTVHPTLAGHVEYDLRVFRPLENGKPGFEPAPMENMPDVTALAKDARLRAELLAYLREPATLSALDDGTLALPERFLAKRAISVSPRGLTRRANRPYRRLFEPEDFSDLDLGSYRTVRSGTALLRRLDGASCSGCHQSRSIAGFHHAGADAAGDAAFNSLRSGSSPHLRAELERRRSYVAAVARGEPPNEARPVPERQGVGRGYGAPCSLGDPGLSDWTCAEGFRCVKLEDPEVGACFADPAIGSPCEYGEMLPGAAPHRDYVGKIAHHACGDRRSCDRNISGFPLGTCGGSCSDEAGGACGDFLDVDGFQACLRARRSFGECAEKHVFASGLRACDDANPCRQDYVCVRTRRKDAGACVPPYFVYQLRLDGYPLTR